MGLLNDAIREHLELKRQRGADPEELARIETEALGSPRPELGDHQYPEPQAAEEVSGDERQPLTHDTAEAGGGQETIELDMQSVMASPDSPAAEETAALPAEHDPGSLEWEMPGDAEVSDEHVDDSEEQVEDVLEETPDFLQETPEHERLWFEQRPPRDFDFDK